MERCEHCGTEGEPYGDLIAVRREDGTWYHVCLSPLCWKPDKRKAQHERARSLLPAPNAN